MEEKTNLPYLYVISKDESRKERTVIAAITNKYDLCDYPHRSWLELSLFHLPVTFSSV